MWLPLQMAWLPGELISTSFLEVMEPVAMQLPEDAESSLASRVAF